MGMYAGIHTFSGTRRHDGRRRPAGHKGLQSLLVAAADTGELARIMSLFRDEGVGIEYLYASLEHKVDKAVIVIKVDDVGAGLAMLEKHGFVTVPTF